MGRSRAAVRWPARTARAGRAGRRRAVRRAPPGAAEGRLAQRSSTGGTACRTDASAAFRLPAGNQQSLAAGVVSRHQRGPAAGRGAAILAAGKSLAFNDAREPPVLWLAADDTERARTDRDRLVGRALCGTRL